MELEPKLQNPRDSQIFKKYWNIDRGGIIPLHGINSIGITLK
jgi:hypothetical protein